MGKLNLIRLEQPMENLTTVKEGKPWYKSKTIWFNVVTMVGAAFDVLFSSFYLIEPLIAPVAYPLILLFIGIVNAILRSITTQALTKQREEDWRAGREDVRVD